jgi:phage gpG-like protein
MIGIEFNPDTALAGIEVLLRRAGNLTPALEEIGSYGVSRIQEGFEGKRDPYGNAWKSSIRASETGGKTLQDTWALYNSFREYRVEGDTVEWGSNKIYAAVHQFGAEIRAKNARALRFKIGNRWATKQAVKIPARPILPIQGEQVVLPDDWQDDVLSILRGYVVGEDGGNG